MLTKIFTVFILVCLPGTGSAFLPILHSESFVSKPVGPKVQSTTLQASLRPLLSTFFSTITRSNSTYVSDDQLQEIEEEEEAQDQDFLLVMKKPAILNHERDFFRQSTRIQAWDEYVLVSILCTSISYNALQSFSLAPYHEGIYIYESVIQPLIQIVSGASCLSGVYATMVFSLSILYSRTALGAERDVQYDHFLENTLEIRIKAFRAFSMSLGLFALLVVMVLAESLPLVWFPYLGIATLGLLNMGLQDWIKLVDEATPIYLDDD